MVLRRRGVSGRVAVGEPNTRVGTEVVGMGTEWGDLNGMLDTERGHCSSGLVDTSP